MEAITIGFDLAKHWFQVHRVDAVGNIVVERRLRRAEVVAFFRAQEPCLVGMEACATAHHWARELLTLGDEVKLMPPANVKAPIQEQRGGRRGDLRSRVFPVKDVDQQAVLMMPGAQPARSSADDGGQCAARASRRIWRRRAAGSAPFGTFGCGD
jgi:transposase